MDGYRVEANLYKALAHPVRLQVLHLLSRQEACVCHITVALEQRQPYVSQQLAVLRDAGLVVDRREGNLIYYRLRDEWIAALLAVGRQVAVNSGAVAAAAYPAIPEGAMQDCPCPRCAPGRVEPCTSHSVAASS